MAVCEPWATSDDVPADCDPGSGEDADIFQDYLDTAGELLYLLSGRQFTGECTETVRPCANCGCSTVELCSCTGLPRTMLTSRYVRAVTRVTVDGVNLPDTEYRLDGHRWLVRLPDAAGVRRTWPCCQDLALPATEDRTWEVEFTYGRDIPKSGKIAAVDLTCELWKARSGDDDCQLPPNVRALVRQGVSIEMHDLQGALSGRRTGIKSVDLFLDAVNPKRIRREARIWSPDVPPKAWHAG